MDIFSVLCSKEFSKSEKVEAVNRIIRQQGLNVVHKVDYKGKLPLHYATELGSLALVYILKTMGSDLNAVDESGRVPLHYAVLSKNTLIVDVLAYENELNDDDERVRTDLNLNISATATGETALHMACATGDLAMASSLKLLGANLASIDYYGRTPYDLVPEELKELFTQFPSNNQVSNPFFGSSTASSAFSTPIPVVQEGIQSSPRAVNKLERYFQVNNNDTYSSGNEFRKKSRRRKPRHFGN